MELSVHFYFQQEVLEEFNKQNNQSKGKLMSLNNV